MSFKTLISIAEDGPWCGTRPPGPYHPPRFGAELASLLQSADPQPQPWAVARVEVGLYAAISLYQLGKTVAGPAGEAFGSAADSLFDDTCGSVPLSVLIWLLLHQPPPPSWLQQVTFAGQMLAFAQDAKQDALAKAAYGQVIQGLKALGGAGATAQAA